MEIPYKAVRPVPAMPKTNRPVLMQPTFNWKSPGKHLKFFNLEIKVNSFLKSYNIQESKIVPVIMNRLGHDGLRFMQVFNNPKQGQCQTSPGLFEVLSEKCRPQQNETILSWQYCKLKSEQGENTEE